MRGSGFNGRGTIPVVHLVVFVCFTKGLSPIMSALLVSEARAEAKINSCKPLFLVTLYSRKAFGVVNHIIMLDKLYEAGIHPTLQASKYLKIGTCPASQNVLAYLGKS